MQIDSEKADKWLTNLEASMPNLAEIILSADNNVLIIGKAVFYLYHDLDLIPSPKTATGDIDISIGISNDLSDYDDIRAQFIASGYTLDTDPHYPFRIHSPRKLPGAINYVDLLIHPVGQRNESKYKEKMGVGPEWDFQGVISGLNCPFELGAKLFAPNPLGIIGQKAQSYFVEPAWRRRDLADIAELVDGLVQNGVHFDLGPVWKDMLAFEPSQCNLIAGRLRAIADDDAVEWDLGNVSGELEARHYSEEDIEVNLPEKIREFVEQVFDD